MSEVALIWAMTDDGIIGRDNAMPWHLPADMAWFRQHTLDGSVIMGRKTFHSLGDRPLPRRTNIIISRGADYRPEGVTVVPSPAMALAAVPDDQWAMVIGGSQIYATFLPMASRLYVTRIHASIPGDSYFPSVDWSKWTCTERHEHPVDVDNAYAMTFEIHDHIHRHHPRK